MTNCVSSVQQKSSEVFKKFAKNNCVLSQICLAMYNTFPTKNDVRAPPPLSHLAHNMFEKFGKFHFKVKTN